MHVIDGLKAAWRLLLMGKVMKFTVEHTILPSRTMKTPDTCQVLFLLPDRLPWRVVSV